MLLRIVGLMLIFQPIIVQGQWTDNFLDGNYYNNKIWSGDSLKFTINQAFELQLNAPTETGSAILSTESVVTHKAEWTFKIRMEFNPSSGNYARIYLMSDKSDISGPLNGYFIRIGHTNDDLCLYRQEGTTETLIADGRDKIFNTPEVNARIKITRNEQWNWELSCDTTGGNNFRISATGNDSLIRKSAHFGIRCFYTSTRSKKIFFDDFAVSGEMYTDGIIPRIQSCKVINNKQVSLSFSEDIDSASVRLPSNYQINNNSIDSISWSNKNSKAVQIFFTNQFTCESNNQLTIKNITDTWNLPIRDSLFLFTYCTPGNNDLVFNEIMADPSPTVNLPSAEYIEIYNRTKHSFDLSNFILQIGSYNYTFPEMNLSAESFLLITSKTNQPLLSQFGLCLGLFSSSTALNNGGAKVLLKNSQGVIITQLEYKDTWYDDEFKAQGGWSLEQIDPWNPCGGIINWKASKSVNGGTPGKINSIHSSNPDLFPPTISSVNVVSPSQVEIEFTEPLDSISGMNSRNYEITPEIGFPAKITRTDNEYSSFTLWLNEALKPGKIYIIKTLGNIEDCAGNKTSHIEETPIALSVKPDSADAVINEVLFNAKTGGSDYVEIYNRSQKILSTRNLLIGTRVIGKTEGLCRVKETGSLFFPGQYLLIASDLEKIKAFYTTGNEKDLVRTPCFPPLDDKSAILVLLNDTFGKVDEFAYSEKMHVATLRNTEGISLERVNPDKAGIFPGNWHSAAETVGYGTPGFRNSQYHPDSIPGTEITIHDEVFSPDNDGYKDFLWINYSFDQPECRVQVSIFDSSGRIVRKLLTNELLGTNGSFSWDGTNDAGRMCTVGLYVIFIRTIFEDDTVKEYKKTCVLATKR